MAETGANMTQDLIELNQDVTKAIMIGSENFQYRRRPMDDQLCNISQCSFTTDQSSIKCNRKNQHLFQKSSSQEATK
jgi:hypothetical protein